MRPIVAKRIPERARIALQKGTLERPATAGVVELLCISALEIMNPMRQKNARQLPLCRAAVYARRFGE